MNRQGQLRFRHGQKRITDVPKAKPDHDVYRFVQIKSAMLFALLEELPVTVLGDTALTRAGRVQDACETLRHYHRN
jgi:hypothetical protein